MAEEVPCSLRLPRPRSSTVPGSLEPQEPYAVMGRRSGRGTLAARSSLRRWSIFAGIAVATFLASVVMAGAADSSHDPPHARDDGRGESAEVNDTPSHFNGGGDLAPAVSRRHLLAPTCTGTSSITVRFPHSL